VIKQTKLNCLTVIKISHRELETENRNTKTLALLNLQEIISRNQHRQNRHVESQGVGNLPSDANLKKWGDSNFLPTKSQKWAR